MSKLEQRMLTDLSKYFVIIFIKFAIFFLFFVYNRFDSFIFSVQL